MRGKSQRVKRREKRCVPYKHYLVRFNGYNLSDGSNLSSLSAKPIEFRLAEAPLRILSFYAAIIYPFFSLVNRFFDFLFFCLEKRKNFAHFAI